MVLLDSIEVDSFVITTAQGETKIEGLSKANGKELEQFFISIQQEQQNVVQQQQPKKTSREDQLRRTVQIKKQSSELCLGASFRDEISRTGGTPRLRSETVHHASAKSTKLSRTISSKSFKRTLSVGKFSKEKISKIPEESNSNSNSPKPKSEFSFQSLTDKMKRRKVNSSSAPVPRKSSKKKKGTL